MQGPQSSSIDKRHGNACFYAEVASGYRTIHSSCSPSHHLSLHDSVLLRYRGESSEQDAELA